MKRLFSIIFTIFFLVPTGYNSFAQKEEKAESEFVTMLFPSYAYQFPGGDLAKRFGNSSTIGPGFLIKTKSNWLFGIDANFIFGNNIKEDSLLNNLLTNKGYVIDENGVYADLNFFERGFYSSFKIGKIFPVFGSNPNSGIVFLAGAGYIQHKIRIEVKNNTAPQLRGDYKKGYDRFCDGIQLNEFIGYFYIGKTRLANFFAGFEFVQAWTENRRSMTFDIMRREDEKRLDLLYSFKIGWIIPLHKRQPKDYYYY